MAKWHNYNGSQSNKDRKAINKLRRDILAYVQSCCKVRVYHDEDNNTFENRVDGQALLEECFYAVCHDDNGNLIVSSSAFSDAIEWLEDTGRITSAVHGWIHSSYSVLKANPSKIYCGVFFDDADLGNEDVALGYLQKVGIQPIKL